MPLAPCLLFFKGRLDHRLKRGNIHVEAFKASAWWVDLSMIGGPSFLHFRCGADARQARSCMSRRTSPSQSNCLPSSSCSSLGLFQRRELGPGPQQRSESHRPRICQNSPRFLKARARTRYRRDSHATHSSPTDTNYSPLHPTSPVKVAVVERSTAV